MKRSESKAAMRERILAAADRLFYSQGIRAVGVDTIAAEIGISKRTLYNHFPSKDDLIVAYLSQRLVVPPAPSSLPPAEEILRNFDRLERSFASDVFRGCPFVNAVAELKEPAHAANEIARAFKEQRRLRLRNLLNELNVHDAEAIAMQLMLLIDGAIATAVVRRDASAARAGRAAARTLLAAAGVKLPAEPRTADRTQRAKRRFKAR